MAKTQTQTTKPATSSKVAPKAAKNTPAVKKEAPKVAAAKEATKPAQKTTEKKAHVFALVAGVIAAVEHKGLKKAIAYHVSKGNLAKTDKGITLTAQGATTWTKERKEADPAKFQELAAFIKGGETPKEFKGQPVTKIGEGMQFPNMLYWGSFSTTIMRQAFAAIWAK